ncbi:MAG: hypothetical protein WDZ80_01085 [Candidatus Paceibacterota bacterium]
MREGLVHDAIMNIGEVQADLRSILNIGDNAQFVHEDAYINGIIADFTVLNDQKIRAIIECKAGDINVTDYVRGIGQTLQYEYFNEEDISPRGFKYDEVFNSVLLFPSSVVKDNSFNIARFKYPKKIILVEMNNVNKVIRKIENSELKKLKESVEQNLVTISQYYIRDNRLYELYILLKYVAYQKLKGTSEVKRKETEESFLRKIETQNNGNWRNAFISLASLGLIDSKNLPTPSGFRFANLEYEEFLVEVLNSYIKPYFEVILSRFIEGDEMDISNKDLLESIRAEFSNRDVLFLTESEGRYLSSWLNILRDDYGCLKFESRSSKRTMKFNLLNLNETALIEKIKESSVAYQYIEKYYSLLNN